jgi:PAS domain S-box-containing protein
MLPKEKPLEKQQIFSLAIEMCTDGIIIGDLTGKITYVNQALLKMYGSKDKTDLIGKQILEFIAEKDQARTRKISAECRKTGQCVATEFATLPKNGLEIPVEATIAVIKDDNGTEIGFIDVVRDIRERKKTEEILKKQAQLINLSPLAIIIKKIDDTIVFWSQGAQDLYGWTEEEAIGKKSRELFKTEFPESYEKIISQLERGGCWSGEKKQQTKFDQQVSVKSRWLASYNGEGKVDEILETNVDITELELMHEKLREYTEGLELTVQERTRELVETQTRLVRSERLATIGELAGMVGHDLRNPLAGIKNANYFLKKKYNASLDDKGKEMLAIIDRSVEHADNIVGDLLDYSREIKLELEEYSPKSLIDYVLLSIKPSSRIKIIDHTESFPTILVDANKIERVFVNLIRNAIDAMPEGGTLEVSSRQNGENVELAFADTGIGMSSDVIAKIFTPLFTTKAQGMGLGLAICKRVVEAHHGKITVESTLNKGTIFTITLPINQNQIEKND